VKAVCVPLDEPGRQRDGWLTLHREYQVLEVLAQPGRSIKFRVMSDKGRVPILVESTKFAAVAQPLPRTWSMRVSQDGLVERAPARWLEVGYWEKFFDRDPEAVAIFHEEVQAMTT
jgi:hypothetical protein